MGHCASEILRDSDCEILRDISRYCGTFRHGLDAFNELVGSYFNVFFPVILQKSKWIFVSKMIFKWM